ncbi:phage major capsid protein, P2 family [Photobacterium phosphoreum]|jgi:P2 family phage major capsid protein|uniref:phage major capsid protein, P2 family n=1 Tax=Photobacterium phosphoreum TaxID=659 RepID=UPI0005D38B7B|nr:phage major capsid protein, P2 family [Photobacterium phosphoreum]KJF86527.1 oxidoreductase [Photobacterium phosphoreum]MCD9510148.1 phage major capsid protein, P2 family [Photobacterium phosphoreum]PSU61412.1 phage major capsid protein, P2 family [Photobacterium phosphoreum]PSV68863.1 phage major capsid protein, P2 family [Photobacterium phosphoreum]
MGLNVLATGYVEDFTTELAKQYGISDPSKQFAITGPKETQLRKALLESVDFLKAITTQDVDQIKGQVVDVGINTLRTGRKSSGRFKSTVGVDGNEYELIKTDSCAALPWSLLCVWANAGSAGEFMRLINETSNQSFALDMIRIGFNGVSVSEDTDPKANPLGEDVNKGWQQLVKEKHPKQVIEVDVYLDPTNGTYKSLDAMASDLIHSCIDPSFQNDPRLVVYVGSDLVAAEQQRLLNAATTPTEKNAAQQLANTIAGRRALTPPFFPSKRMTVTIPKNLIINTQKGTRKRKAQDVEDREAFESTYWRMEGYAVAEPKAYASFDEAHVTIGPKPAEG